MQYTLARGTAAGGTMTLPTAFAADRSDFRSRLADAMMVWNLPPIPPDAEEDILATVPWPSPQAA